MTFLVGGLFAAVVSAILESATSVATDKGTGRLLEAIAGVRDEQMALMTEIDRKVKRLVEGPFNAGLVFLDDAARARRSPVERRELLLKARDRFFDALGNEGDNRIRRPFIELYLGLTYVALDSWPDAEERFESATTSALEDGTARSRQPIIRGRWYAPVDETVLVQVGKLVDRLRAARIALGALPTSVPLLVPSGTGGQVAWWIEEISRDDRDYDRAPDPVPYGRRAEVEGERGARYWTRYHRSHRAEAWHEGMLFSTSELDRFVEGGPPPVWLGWRRLGDNEAPIGIVSLGLDSPWLNPEDAREAAITIATDIVSERRAGWPDRWTDGAAHDVGS